MMSFIYTKSFVPSSFNSAANILFIKIIIFVSSGKLHGNENLFADSLAAKGVDMLPA